MSSLDQGGENLSGQPDDQPASPDEEALVAQGFTLNEARQLLVVADRDTRSDESRVAEATLRRLRFTRWMIDHGMLDEWSA